MHTRIQCDRFQVDLIKRPIPHHGSPPHLLIVFSCRLQRGSTWISTLSDPTTMRSSGHSITCVAGLQLLLFQLATCGSYDLWAFDPDYNTARPAPSLIPPISKNASTDTSLLKWQILGIVGGYVITVVFIFSLLMTVGRRLRRAAQSSHGTLSMEMVKPNRWMQDPSPKVKSTSAFQKWGKKTPTASPASTSQATFDGTTVASHKERQEQDMERLYAAVFDNETKAPKEISIQEEEVGLSGHTRNLSASSKRSFSQRRPPQLAGQGAEVISPQSPPATYQQPGFATSAHSMHSRHGSDTSSTKSKTTPTLNNVSGQRTSKSKETKSLRNLKISAPIPTNKYPGVEKDDEASTPLSPRYPESSLPASPLKPRPITPIQDEFDVADDDVARPYSYEELDQPRPLPTAAPQRGPTSNADRRIPPPLPPPPKDVSPISAGSSTNQLPFRQHTQAPSGSTLGGTTVGPGSPGVTKTTYLSPRRDRFQPGHGHPHGFVGVGGPTSAGLGSAALATPYSPYMPFSPVTPVTPRLTTRAERKQRQKEEGKRVANADEDLVKDEKEMWGDGW